jgi:hypothetical protein
MGLATTLPLDFSVIGFAFAVFYTQTNEPLFKFISKYMFLIMVIVVTLTVNLIDNENWTLAAFIASFGIFIVVFLVEIYPLIIEFMQKAFKVR